MPKILATSDLHGNLPEIPDCDILIVAGDVCPDHPIGKVARYDLPLNGAHYQLAWLAEDFMGWLKDLRRRGIRVVGIAGNHDFVFEKMPASVEELGLPWTYLKDSGTVIDDLRLWGTPWVPGLPQWAFYASEEGLRARMDLVPLDTDILVSHGPPYGTADFVAPRYGSKHVGDVALADWMKTKRQNSVVVCGHIHEQYGRHRQRGLSPVYNVSHNDEIYGPIKRPPMLLREFLK